MAVPEQTPYKEYTANGNTTSFALGFICESKNDLIVLVDGVAPPVATWSLIGANAVFNTAPASGKKIVLQRNTAMSRTTNYQGNNNSFRPETINKDIDRVWLKLQELGVADMLLKIYVDRLHGEQKDYIDNKDQLVRNIIGDLRNYVNQQDGSLSSDINNLRTYVNQQDTGLAQSISILRNHTDQLHSEQKNYIDQQDNNRNSYFENLISRQGVSLQQLDEYYNYLMQRLAQIAVDKGWDASFVVDASGKNQQELNNALKQTILDRLNIRDFGAILDGTEHKLSEKFSTLTMAQVAYPFATSIDDTLDFCAYQAAINYATTKGFNNRPVQGDRTGRGAIVYAPSGQAVINRPLIMPRSGNFDGASVYIEGETISSSAIAATSTFPAGRALIEWEDSAQRTYWQGIRNIAFRLPDVVDTKAIWFKKSSTCIAGGSTTSLIFAEYMHGLKLEHITVEGSNSYHKNCIQFDGYVRFSKFDHLISNLGLGPDPIYNTIYLQFASDYGTSSVIKGESNGVAYSEINNIWGMGQRGGNGVLVKGRFLESSGKNWVNGNGTTDTTPAFEINSSYIFTLTQTGSEGRAEKPQYLIKNSIGVNLESIGLGGSDGDGGVGVKFESCESCTLNGRYATPSDPSFSSKNGKAVIIDANCINVKVSNFYISANPELEFEILAPLSAGNSIAWIHASTKAQGTYLAGGSAGMKDIVIATKNAAQAVPPESEFTLITWPNVQLDTNSKMNGATGEYTAGKISTVRVSGGFTILNAVLGQVYEVNVAVNGVKSDRLAYFTAATEGAIFLTFDKIVRIAAASQRIGVGINNTSTTTAINIGQYNTLGNFSVEEIS